MLLYWKLVDETQMGNPRVHAARDISSKFSIFLSLRAIWKKPYHYETPCSFFSTFSNFLFVLYQLRKLFFTLNIKVSRNSWKFYKPEFHRDDDVQSRCTKSKVWLENTDHYFPAWPNIAQYFWLGRPLIWVPKGIFQPSGCEGVPPGPPNLGQNDQWKSCPKSWPLLRHLLNRVHFTILNSESKNLFMSFFYDIFVIHFGMI